MGEPFLAGDEQSELNDPDMDDGVNGFILKSAILSTAGKFVCEEMLSAMNTDFGKKEE